MHWDVIIVGLGGVGSAAAYHVARTGQRVLGIDQYPPVHAYGSSHGKTRIIRQAYFEHPDYVPLLRRAYVLWDELSELIGEQLFQRTGLVELGPAAGVVIPGVLRSAHEHDLDVEKLTSAEVARRWPRLATPDDLQAVFEHNAGYLRVESCVAAHLRLARQAGATLLHDTPCVEWRTDGAGVVVSTPHESYRASRLIVAAGAWSTQLLHDIGVPLQVVRKHQYWYQPTSSGFSQQDRFPCFFHETPAGFFYGFPAMDDMGVKVARHSGGTAIDAPAPQWRFAGCEPTARLHPPDAQDRTLVEAFTAEYLPMLGHQLQHQAGCYYTLTPDEHFVVALHPQHAQVVVVAGLSGHGFKFTSVLGELACQLAINGHTTLNTELFSIRCR